MALSNSVLEHLAQVAKIEKEQRANNSNSSEFYSVPELKEAGFSIKPFEFPVTKHLAFELSRVNQESGELEVYTALFKSDAFERFPELNNFQANRQSIINRLQFSFNTTEDGTPIVRASLGTFVNFEMI